jgi:hypothetical protein
MHRDPVKGKIYFSVDGRFDGKAKEHLSTRPRSEAKFIAEIGPVALELMRSGIGVMALLKHIRSQVDSKVSWDDIEVNGVSGLPVIYYGGQMQVAMALGAFLLLHAPRDIKGATQVVIQATPSAAEGTRSNLLHRPPDPSTMRSRGVLGFKRPRSSGEGGEGDLRTRKKPRSGS